MKRLALAVVLVVLLGAAGTASAGSRTFVHRPHHHLTIHRHFRPWAHPSVPQVQKIIRWEQAKWGGPSLMNRAYCETHFIWNANKGMPYHGVLALGSVAWSILWPGTPRHVRLVRHQRRYAPVYRVTVWASGRRHKRHIASVRQRLKVVRSGHLPKHPTPWHAWASIRAVQRYVAGYTPGSVVWSCPL